MVLLFAVFVLGADINDCVSLISEVVLPHSRPAVLTLKCQLEQCSDVNFLKPQRIKISKVGDEDEILLASIEKNTDIASRAIALGGTPKVSGSMKDNRYTYLVIQWEHPDTDLEGQYSCIVMVTDKSGQRRSLPAKTYVSVTDPVESTDSPGNADENTTPSPGQGLDRKKDSEGCETLGEYKEKLAKLFFLSPLDYNSKRYYMSLQPFVDDSHSDDLCNIVGGYLVEVNDADEYKAMINYVKRNNAPGALISGTDVQKEGRWLYHRSQKPVEYLNWNKGEPNNMGGREHCIVVWVDNGELMNDTVCLGNPYRFPFICEVDQ
ncbi:hypothetical protein Btru_005062 [Bulinus truncatus]|nr:hypothetical protein Btru_005062 [Bulinus truncatus]